ncbi:MAG: hypothetical protein JWO53_1271, partial [Chlamydiia bacterium]|nr:hypothetical protein [Chlamydiia bacterium]
MRETTQNIAIGLVSTAAVFLVIWVLLFLHPSLGDNKSRVRVRFANIEKIGKGTRVTYAGKPIGEVIAIKMIPEAQRSENGDQNDLFAYELTLGYDSKVQLFTSDEITVKTSGLMGEKTIAITPRRIRGQEPQPVVFNQLIYASASDSVEEAFSNIQNVTKKFEQTMDEVKELQADFRKTLASITSTSDEVRKLIKQASDANIVGDVKSIMTKTDSVLTTISTGQGSIGKLVMKDDFYMKSVATLQKTEILLNDINTYGALFHLDKNWQRERKKRTEAIASLKNPRDFSAYMDTEL